MTRTNNQDRLNSLLERVNTAFNAGIRDHQTHGQILDALTHVYAHEYWRKLRQYQHWYVRGYVLARFNEIWRNHVAWGFRPNGVFVADFNVVLRDYHDAVERDQCNGFHYWIGSEDPFTLPMEPHNLISGAMASHDAEREVTA